MRDSSRESVREKGKSAQQRLCATYVTAPSARGILKPFLTRRRVLTYVRPRAHRHSVAHWFSRSRLTTIAPNCSLPSFAPTFSRLSVGLRRRSPSPVYFALHYQRPNNPRHLVCQCHSHKHRWLARQHSCQPSAWPRHWMDMLLYDDAVGTNDQQSPERSLAHLRGRAKALWPCPNAWCKRPRAEPLA